MPKNASKTGKSSKTARVLSLLTDPAASLLGGSRGRDDEPQEAEEKTQRPSALTLDDAATENRIQDSLLTELFGNKEPPKKKEPTPAQTQTPPPQVQQEPDPQTMNLLSMLSNPSTLGNSAMPLDGDHRPTALSSDTLDELLEGMPEQPPHQPEPAQAQPMAQPVTQAQPMAQPAQAQSVTQAQPMAQPAQPVTQAQPMAQPVTQAQPIAQQPAQPAAPPSNAVQQKHEEFICFNLTQALVEDKADKLMKQFGMCTCNRCRVDVTAIALSNLPAKYVAMQNRDILPLLSMYEERYSAAVTVQVMRACRMVMERPHHGRR